MLAVPISLSQAFEVQLNQRNVPDRQRRDFHKWLRFYLDFCNKYDSNPKLTASFAAFDEKLQSKGQSETQRQQARRAIAIYYRMIGAIKSPATPSSDSLPETSLASKRLAEPTRAPLHPTDLTLSVPENLSPSPVDKRVGCGLRLAASCGGPTGESKTSGPVIPKFAPNNNRQLILSLKDNSIF